MPDYYLILGLPCLPTILHLVFVPKLLLASSHRLAFQSVERNMGSSHVNLAANSAVVQA